MKADNTKLYQQPTTRSNTPLSNTTDKRNKDNVVGKVVGQYSNEGKNFYLVDTGNNEKTGLKWMFVEKEKVEKAPGGGGYAMLETKTDGVSLSRGIHDSEQAIDIVTGGHAVYAIEAGTVKYYAYRGHCDHSPSTNPNDAGYWFYLSSGAYAILEYKDPSKNEDRKALYYHLSNFAQGVTKPAGLNRHYEVSTSNDSGKKYTPMRISEFNSAAVHPTIEREVDSGLVGTKAVKKGDLIGYTGNTGNSVSTLNDAQGKEAGFHLHFAVTKANETALAGNKLSFYKPWFKFID